MKCHIIVIRTYIRDVELGTVMLSACCVGWKVEGFGGDEEAGDDEEREEEDEKEAEEEDVAAEDVVESDSESDSPPSEGSAAFCFGNTVGARTDRPEMRNVSLGDLFRLRWRVIFDSHTTICRSLCQIESQKIHKKKQLTSIVYLR